MKAVLRAQPAPRTERNVTPFSLPVLGCRSETAVQKARVGRHAWRAVYALCRCPAATAPLIKAAFNQWEVIVMLCLLPVSQKSCYGFLEVGSKGRLLGKTGDVCGGGSCLVPPSVVDVGCFGRNLAWLVTGAAGRCAASSDFCGERSWSESLEQLPGSIATRLCQALGQVLGSN